MSDSGRRHVDIGNPPDFVSVSRLFRVSSASSPHQRSVTGSELGAGGADEARIHAEPRCQITIDAATGA
eukprot:8067002-Prorocentrum_lima.AAC.1